MLNFGPVKSIAILISGRGSNMEAVVRACAARHWLARIAVVISSRGDAPGLETAASLGIPIATVDVRGFPDRARFEDALGSAIDAVTPDLIVLSGFMRILSDAFVERYEGKMLNIHPSLLPSFPGLATHRQALARGVKVHGATVHFVTNHLDGGPIVAQAVVAVSADDTEHTLAERVLMEEHRLLPAVIEYFVKDELQLQSGHVTMSAAAAKLLCFQRF